MSGKKYYYYVLVFSNYGPVYVTSIDNNNQYVHWDKDKEPLEVGASYGEDLVIGLNLNFNHAVLIKSRVRIDHQPYRYEAYDCTFVNKSEENKEEK